MESPNGQQLARQFEQVAMKNRVDQLEDVDDLRMIAKRLIDLNYGMKDQFSEMIAKGWLG